MVVRRRLRCAHLYLLLFVCSCEHRAAERLSRRSPHDEARSASFGKSLDGLLRASPPPHKATTGSGPRPTRLSAVLSRARAAHGPPPEVYSSHLGLDECREIALHTSTLRRRQRRAHLGLTDEDKYLFI